MWSSKARALAGGLLGLWVGLWASGTGADPAVDEILKRSQETVRDAESYVCDVYEELVATTRLTTLTSLQYCVERASSATVV